MHYEHFATDIRDGAALIAFAGSGNPRMSSLCEEFVDLMLRLQDDAAVRALAVVDGEHAFDVAPDLDTLSQNAATNSGFENLAAELEISGRLVSLIQDYVKPVVMATRGDIRTTGLGLFLAGDVRLASRTASFTGPDLTTGLMPDLGLTHSLPRLLGPGRALEFMWSGRTLSATEAFEIGLVDRVVSDDTFEDALEQLLDRLAHLPQPLVRLTKMAVQQSGQLDLTSMLSFEFEAQQQCWDSHESTESLVAWQENRRPVFHVPTAPEDDE